jgi:hypothetical protein
MAPYQPTRVNRSGRRTQRIAPPHISTASKVVNNKDHSSLANKSGQRTRNVATTTQARAARVSPRTKKHQTPSTGVRTPRIRVIGRWAACSTSAWLQGEVNAWLDGEIAKAQAKLQELKAAQSDSYTAKTEKGQARLDKPPRMLAILHRGVLQILQDRSSNQIIYRSRDAENVRCYYENNRLVSIRRIATGEIVYQREQSNQGTPEDRVYQHEEEGDEVR